ncbi:MAG: hypothetical protein ABSA64_08595 [Sedimentisphaerales bacterium]
MAKSKLTPPIRPNNEIRRLMLQYFYDRNKNATSSMGKKGSAVKISDIKAELKSQHSLNQQEVQSNLTYLLSQGWVEEKKVEKQIRARGGTIIPSTTNYYQITAAGIDKIEGPGEFTMPKFEGINIHATGHNIITLGDGNQVNAQYSDLGQALVELRKAITQSEVSEDQKMSFVADIDTIESQLAKTQPNRSIIMSAWDAVKAAAAINGCSALVAKVGGLIAGFLGVGN